MTDDMLHLISIVLCMTPVTRVMEAGRFGRRGLVTVG